jgi:prepilin peptidase CpaA
MFTGTPTGLFWGALFTALLLVACVTDVRTRRIPNVLVLVVAIGGVLFSVATRPLPQALVASGTGVALGFAIWIGFWLAGVIGAGDVKFFAAIGAWLGPAAVWRAALVAALLGGVLAVVVLLRARRLKDATTRLSLAFSAGSLAVLGRVPDGDGPRRRHLPYGVALAAGAFLIAWFPELIR